MNGAVKEKFVLSSLTSLKNKKISYGHRTAFNLHPIRSVI